MEEAQFTLAPKHEIEPEILSIHALNRFAMNDASARCGMYGQHFSQRPVIEGSESKYILTGVEEEFGKFTFAVRMPEDGVIVAKIVKHGNLPEAIEYGHTPETLCIYQSEETGEFGCFTLPYYSSHDPVFGFKYQKLDTADQLSVGASFAKGTRFADSPAVKGESHYTFSHNVNLAYMSHANVGLDGFVISDRVLDKFKFRLYERRTIQCGANGFLLNTYGDLKEYKAFPNIGEYIKESGLVAVLRSNNTLMAPATTSRLDVMKPDYLFDTPVFSRPGKGRVIDIDVVESPGASKTLPPEMESQLRRYANSNLGFYREIYQFYMSEVKKNKREGGTGALKLSHELHMLIHEAKGRLENSNNDTRDRLFYTRKGEPTDTWEISFVIEYEMTPNRGNKFTCLNGGKGVACRIEAHENMPRDSDGNVADFITGPDSVPGRQNLGRLHEPFFSAAARDIRKNLLEALGLDRQWKGRMTADELLTFRKEDVQFVADELKALYEIVSPETLHAFEHVWSPEEQYDHIADVLTDKIHLYMRIKGEDDAFPPGDLVDMALRINKRFKLVYGPVSYVGHSGIRKTTRSPVRIAPCGFMLLDKIADDWMASSTSKHNNFGIITARVRADKYSRPWRTTPPRVVGITEARLYNAYGGELLIAELLDRSGNIATQRKIAERIAKTHEPLNQEKLISRKEIPFGNTRPLQMVKQFTYCMGIEFVYVPEEGTRPELRRSPFSRSRREER